MEFPGLVQRAAFGEPRVPKEGPMALLASDKAGQCEYSFNKNLHQGVKGGDVTFQHTRGHFVI